MTSLLLMTMRVTNNLILTLNSTSPPLIIISQRNLMENKRELTLEEFASLSSIIELVNEIEEHIPCKLI